MVRRLRPEFRADGEAGNVVEAAWAGLVARFREQVERKRDPETGPKAFGWRVASFTTTEHPRKVRPGHLMSDNVPWPSQGGTRKAKWGCEPVAQRPGVGQNIRSRLDAVCGTGWCTSGGEAQGGGGGSQGGDGAGAARWWGEGKCGRTALTKERPRFRKEVDLMLLPQRTVRPSSGLASSGLVTLT